MSRKEVPEIWVSRISEYKARSEPGPAWCERNHVTPKQLYYWMNKLKQQQALSASRPQFLPICLDEAVAADAAHQSAPDHQASGAAALFIRIGPAIVEVGPGFDASLLAEVVGVLKNLC